MMVPVMYLAGTTTIVGVGGYPAEDADLYTVVEMDDQDPAVQAYVNPPRNVVLDSRQFWTQMAVQGLIDESEAVDAQRGTIPQDIRQFINALPFNKRFAARMFFTATTFTRRSRVGADLKAIFTLDDAAVLAFFVAAEKL